MKRLGVSERDYFGLYYAVREQRVGWERGCVCLCACECRTVQAKQLKPCPSFLAQIKAIRVQLECIAFTCHFPVPQSSHLAFLYGTHTQFFLDPLKTGARQYPDSKASQWVLHFGVKYYVPDPHLLKDDFTK